jgi:hypothetical protein
MITENNGTVILFCFGILFLSFLTCFLRWKRTANGLGKGCIFDTFLPYFPEPVPLYAPIPMSRAMKASLEATNKLVSICFDNNVVPPNFVVHRGSNPGETQNGGNVAVTYGGPFVGQWRLIVTLRTIVAPCFNYQRYAYLLKGIHMNYDPNFTSLHKTIKEWDTDSNSHRDNDDNPTNTGGNDNIV